VYTGFVQRGLPRSSLKNAAAPLYENMKKAIFDPYSEDLDDLRDGKLFMATATENDVAASVVAIIPATQPDISKDHFVVWSNNRVSFWSDNIADMNTTPDNEILVGDVSIMVVDDHGMARGIAVYMETLNGASRALSLRPLMPSWGEERDKHGRSRNCVPRSAAGLDEKALPWSAVTWRQSTSSVTSYAFPSSSSLCHQSRSLTSHESTFRSIRFLSILLSLPITLGFARCLGTKGPRQSILV